MRTRVVHFVFHEIEHWENQGYDICYEINALKTPDSCIAYADVINLLDSKLHFYQLWSVFPHIQVHS
jgi:hypothetical protein